MTVSIEVLELKIARQEAEINELKRHVVQIDRERQEDAARRALEEKKRMTAAMLALGSVILTLGGVIWSYRSVIFRGTD